MFKSFGKKSILLSALLIIVLLLTVSGGAAQENGGLTAVPGSLTATTSVPSSSSKAGTAGPVTQGIVPSDLDVASIIVTYDSSVTASDLEAVSGGKVIHQYSEVFNGASLVLAGEKVDAVASLSGVTGIYLDQLLQVDTEVSPSFIGAPMLWNNLGGQEEAGEGVIVGVLDTGIWPEHPSFSDPDPAGNPYPAPPTLPGSNGFGSGGTKDTCDFGDTTWNANDAPFTCNNKLIGAYDFLDTYKAIVGLLPDEFDSARDSEGHGTHTASTSAGNGGVAASIFGVPRGIVSGIAPRAHVIMYRVCAAEGCYSSDSARAVEQAILDGADAINFSISGGGNPYSDAVELAFSVAYENGVFVSASAGNSGPSAETVDHRGPWTMTVGASTTDRHFISTVTVEAANGDTLEMEGATVTDGISTPTPVVLASDHGDGLCLTPFAAGTFSGEIVVCERGTIARVAKSFNVAAGGAGGLLLYNPVLQGLATDNHFIPSVHLENDAGVALLDFIGTHTGVTATFTPGIATAVQGDKMAAFSSRGGPAQPLGISKPDITAPGVQILAGHSPLPHSVDGGLPGELFQAIQGTSMSSPHIAGSAALVKALHPDWTPGQIKSALMMTANGDHFKEDGVTPADPFDYGSGRVDLSKAGGAGLTISDSVANYMALEDELWHANYPSLYVPIMPGRITVQRTVHNETNHVQLWRLTVDAPDDLAVTVPRWLIVRGNGDKSFHIKVDARDVPVGEVRHATLYFTRWNQELRFPITIVRQQPNVTLDKVCTPASFSQRDTTTCTITIENTSLSDADVKAYDLLPQNLKLVDGTVVGGNAHGSRLVTFSDTLDAAGAPVVSVTPTSLFGYLPLSSFGVPPFGCPSNCDDGGFLISGLNINYLGQNYADAIWSVNGTLELGTASGVTSSFANQDLPDPAIPNNVLAPWWTDLNLGAGGNWYLATLSGGGQAWDVFEWENVPRFGDSSSTFSFQIWLEQGTENITFVYGPVSSGADTTDGTTGAENHDGLVGDTYYYDGAGTDPWIAGGDLGVLSVPGAPGETHVITYEAKGRRVGEWVNYVEMTGDIFFGTNIARTEGEVTWP